MTLDPPRFKPGDFVTMEGTQPGACHRVLECLGTRLCNNRRWYLIEISEPSSVQDVCATSTAHNPVSEGVRVQICEDDLNLVEVIEELGRIARD